MVAERSDDEMIKAAWKRIGIVATSVYAVAFLLLYTLGCWVATLPAVSPVSLSLAFDTVPERLRFAMHASLWVLLIASPFLFLWCRSNTNRRTVRTSGHTVRREARRP